MAHGPDGSGLGGPERPRTAGPSARRPDTEPVSGRGGAYSAPPPGDGPQRPAGSGMRRWATAGILAAVLIGGGLYSTGVIGGPTQPAAIEQVDPAAVAVLSLGAADVDQPATDLAKQLIASGQLPPAPPAGADAAPGAAGTVAAPAPQVAAPAPATPTPDAQPAATPAPAQPAAPAPAPVVHRPKPAPNAPKPAAPVPAPQAETDQAVRQLLAQAPEETRAGIAGGTTVIYSLHVLDDVVEDGDVVEIFVNGASYGTVPLANTGQDILIPLPVGTHAQVRALARQDGGGGVTFGVVTSQGELRSTVLAVGQSDDWSVTIQ